MLGRAGLVVSMDTETCPFHAGCMAPELVCVTWNRQGEDPQIVCDRVGMHKVLLDMFTSGEIIVGQNVAYDTAVIGAAYPDLVPVIFRAYQENRITDTMLREKLLDISHGRYRGYLDDDGVWRKLGYSLFDLVRRHMNGRLLSKDGFRRRYDRFRDVPLADWPAKAMELQFEAKTLLEREAYKPEAERWYDGLDVKDLLQIIADPPEQCIKYPLDDAATTLAVFRAQEPDADDAVGIQALTNQYVETYAAFVLHLAECWGIRTDAAGVDRLEAQAQAQAEELQERLVAEGLVRKDGSRDTKKAAEYMRTVCEREGLPLRLTAKKGVCLDNDACEATEDSLLLAYTHFTQYGKTLNADVPMLRRGVFYPVHCHFDLADTSRTTCSKPNLQNLRKLPGIRECIIPRPGMCFIQADFPQLELYTLAQVCYSWFGHSALGDMLKAGIDPHTAFASTLMGLSYEEGLALKKSGDKQFYQMRQLAKANNFGRPGALGNKTFVTLAGSAAYGVTITESEARSQKKTYLAMYPEMKEYFKKAEETLGGLEKGTVIIPQSGHIRGGCRYNALNNTPFQGLGARAAKLAMIEVAEACYIDTLSPLYGSRAVLMIHDEIIAETPIENAHAGATELARLMVKGANRVLPDVPVTIDRMEPLAMKVWSKDAKPMILDGRIMPWSYALEGLLGMGAALHKRTISSHS